MQVIYNGSIRILVPEKGYKLVNKTNGITAAKFYLCLTDSPDNYTEVVDDKYIPMDYVADLSELKEITDDTIDVILSAMDEMFSMFEPLMDMVPMTMSLRKIEEPIINPMAKLYALMIQRELKTLNEVPEKFKEDVIKLLEG